MKRFRLIATAVMLLAGCKLGPDYKRPDVDAPAAYKELAPGWKVATPKEAKPKGDWWVVFDDPTLTDLEKQAHDNNQNAKAAYARVKEANAIADVSRSALFPTLSLTASDDHEQLSRNRVDPPPAVPTRFISSDYNVLLNLDYELDIWGRLTRLFESAEAQAEEQQALYENTLLALQATVAQQYFTVRAYDAQTAALTDAVKFRSREFDLTQKRFSGKIASALDVAQSKNLLLSTQSNLLAAQRSRKESEHALAVLLGRPPASFSLTAKPLEDKAPPSPPPGLPSDLLERRPDIAAAEKAVKARNAEIGAAIAAFFPEISLTGTAGLDSGTLRHLFSGPSEAWSVIPELAQPVFNAGLNDAQLKQAHAAYDESVAEYRQQVLTAFQQVEDALSDIELLTQQTGVQRQTLEAAHTTLHLSQVRYRIGIDTYLNVADAEVNDLQSRLMLIDIERQHYLASVAFIQALGGGWK